MMRNSALIIGLAAVLPLAACGTEADQPEQTNAAPESASVVGTSQDALSWLCISLSLNQAQLGQVNQKISSYDAAIAQTQQQIVQVNARLLLESNPLIRAALVMQLQSLQKTLLEQQVVRYNLLQQQQQLQKTILGLQLQIMMSGISCN